MLGILALILFVLILMVGGDRGAVAVMALVGNILLLLSAIYLLAIGVPPLLITILGCVVVSCITLIQQNGKNVKTGAAFLASGITMTGLFLLIYFMIWHAEAGGLNEIQTLQEDVQYYYNVNIHINMLQITACMTLFSTQGAVLDTVLSVSSAVYEVYIHKNTMKKEEIFHTGIHIGKEITGTTINTLLFAYLGESLFLYIYLQNGQFSLETILNSKLLYQDAAMMLFGGIACLVSVPITAICVANILEWKRRRDSNA